MTVSSPSVSQAQAQADETSLMRPPKEALGRGRSLNSTRLFFLPPKRSPEVCWERPILASSPFSRVSTRTCYGTRVRGDSFAPSPTCPSRQGGGENAVGRILASRPVATAAFLSCMRRLPFRRLCDSYVSSRLSTRIRRTDSSPDMTEIPLGSCCPDQALAQEMCTSRASCSWSQK